MNILENSISISTLLTTNSSIVELELIQMEFATNLASLSSEQVGESLFIFVRVVEYKGIFWNQNPCENLETFSSDEVT